MFTRACWEHRRCVCNIIKLCVAYLIECSPTVVRCSALFGDISPMVLGDETSADNFNAYFEIVLDVPDALVTHGDLAYSRTSLIVCRTTGAWWRCPGDTQICASRKPRGTIEYCAYNKLKKPYII